MWIFFNSKSYGVLQLVVGWLHRWAELDTKADHNYMGINPHAVQGSTVLWDEFNKAMCKTYVEVEKNLSLYQEILE